MLRPFSPVAALAAIFVVQVASSAARRPNVVVYPTDYKKQHAAATAIGAIDPCNYGWNNNNSNPPNCRGTITEGCAQYPNGPKCWNGENPDGAYGWINLGRMTNTSAECPAIPMDGIGSLLGSNSTLFPASMADALTPPAGSNLCFLACNKSEVERTGVDPCNAGTIPAGKPLPSWILPPVQALGSPEYFPGPLEMNCYYGGKGWMKDSTMGMCGYKLSLQDSHGAYCKSVTQPGCGLIIDPRRVPCCGGTSRCEENETSGSADGAGSSSRPMCCSCKQQ